MTGSFQYCAGVASRTPHARLTHASRTPHARLSDLLAFGFSPQFVRDLARRSRLHPELHFQGIELTAEQADLGFEPGDARLCIGAFATLMRGKAAALAAPRAFIGRGRGPA